MAKPFQDIRVFSIQDRRSQTTAKRPWLVRWSVDGRQRSKAFRTKSEADRYRARLLTAVERGEQFDVTTGEPTAWAGGIDTPSVYDWARTWLAEQWPEWSPRTRFSAVEALARLVVYAVPSGATRPPDGLRLALKEALRPDSEPLEDSHWRWVRRWSLPLDLLDRQLLAGVERQLGLGDRGQPLAAATAGRFRKVSHACITRAVDLHVLASDPWPPPPKGRSRRKAARAKRSVDVRLLPDPETMIRAITAVRSHQPSSRMYQMMVAVMYYAGLRPSEVIMLRPGALRLPQEGWGTIHVREADISFDESGEPKTGERTVPIPEVLVEMLREWIEADGLRPGDLLFRTRTGRRPTASNWARSWQRALNLIEHPPLRVYDIRHAAATTWLGAGVPLGEVARRMGHSVETLVSTYVGALSGDEAVANQRIDELLAGARRPDLKIVS